MDSTEEFFARRPCLLAPLPEHEVAADLLSEAADAIAVGDINLARERLRQADMPVLFAFAARVMGPESADIQRRRPIEMPAALVSKAFSRMPTSSESRTVYMRDGWRCRFCSCCVVSPRARSTIAASIPGAIPWRKSEGYHGAFYALTASIDHVVPHSAGGGNDSTNLVTACWPCQFGRGAYTIEELGLIDPRTRPPVVDDWDGLSRVFGRSASARIRTDEIPPPPIAAERPVASSVQALSKRAFSSFAAQWLSSIDSRHPPPSRPLIDFLDNCIDIGVSWEVTKVLVARMRFGDDMMTVVGVEPNGDVHMPWSVGGRKKLFRNFAEKLAASIPGAIVYETAKLWKVTRADRKPLDVQIFLANLPAVREALESLYAAMKSAAD